MADLKISALDVVSGLDGTETVPVLQDGANARTTTQAIADLASSGAVYAAVCNGRLTLTSGTPVTTSDVTAATTIYFTPYRGNQVALYDGAAWDLHSFTERSLAVPATTSTVYDVFLYDNAGTLTLEAVAWTNDTTRATALTTQDGIYVKSGALTRRYLGSFRTTSVSGQTEDSLTKRFVWNFYHRLRRQMKKVESTASWNYSSASFQVARNDATNILDFIVGVVEDTVSAQVIAAVANNTSTLRFCYTQIGHNSTTSNDGACVFHQAGTTNVKPVQAQCWLEKYPNIGRNYFSWLEQGAGADTQTWYGSNGHQCGIFGFVWA